MKQLITIFILLASNFSLFSQNPYFASLNQQLLSTNPAFSGTNNQLRLQTNCGVYNAQSSQSSNWFYQGADILIKKHSGLGLSFQRSNVSNGLLIQNQLNLAYSYHFIINKKLKIVPGIQASVFQRRLDRGNPNYVHIPDGRVEWVNDIPAVSQYTNMDFSVGFLIYSGNFYFGASVLSVTQPDEGLEGVSKRPLTQIYQGGYKFYLKSKWNCNAYTFIKLQKWRENFLQYGSYAGYGMFKLHLGHRITNNSINNTLIVGCNFTYKALKVGYNLTLKYYHNISGAERVNSQEVYLSFNFGNKKKLADQNNSDKSIYLYD